MKIRKGLLLAGCAMALAGCVASPGGRTPIVLEKLKHEEALFGWRPPFTPNVPSFDSEDRPYIRSRTESLDETGFVHTLRGLRWAQCDFLDAVRKAVPDFASTAQGGGWLPSRVVFDRDDHAYTLLQVRRTDKGVKNLLLYSRDRCATWQAYPLPPGAFSIEHWTGHNPIAGPPAIALMTKKADHPARWASHMTLTLLFPRKTADGLELGEPVFVTDNCLGMAQHSGGASFAATKDGRTHFLWVETFAKVGKSARAWLHDHALKRKPYVTRTREGKQGSPTYIATYDHKTRQLGEAVLLAYAPPRDDVHNTPGVSLDSEGHLHVITGAHGEPFYHLRSRKPNDAYGGWDGPSATLHGGSKTPDGKDMARQTYLAMVIDQDDTIHIAYRQWRQGVDPYHDGKNYAALSYQRKRKGLRWEDARPLVVAPMPGYSIYYHKLALDHRGRLYLSYSYWNPDEPYKSLPGRYHFRSMLVSRDGGETWHLATTGDFR